METPRRPGQRPARLPPQPNSQPQPPQPLSPLNETSSGSTPSSHRRQPSPYYLPHFLQHPPPFFPPYHYPFLYPYMPPPPPLYPLPPHPPYHAQSRPAGSRSREPVQRYRERENRTSFSSSSRPNPPTAHCHHTVHRIDSDTESPDIRLHEILRATNSAGQFQSLVWLLTHHPKQAQIRRSEVHHSPVESLGPSLLSQPATDPPVHGMRIVSNDFAWDIPIEVRSSSFITVETVLFAIYATLHQPVKPVEWNAVEEPHVKRSAHWARCSRLAKGDSHLCFSEEMSAIRRVDLLGDKVTFRGLAPLSTTNTGNGIEFLLRLGSTSQANHNDRRTRMRRGSF